MSLITFQLMAALLLFIVAMAAGLLPMRFNHNHTKHRQFTDSITNGIFLGAAIFHMLPDAQRGFSEIGLNHYPYALLLCFSGIILLQLIKYIAVYFNQGLDNSRLTGLIILMVLCLHSLIEGATLGINTLLVNAFVIFIAIIAHKSCDSFALASTLKRYPIHQAHLFIITAYSLMTPLGIAIASNIISILSNHSGILVESTLNAIAAGTFIYIGALDAIVQQIKVKNLKQNLIDFVILLGGMSIMALFAIWL